MIATLQMIDDHILMFVQEHLRIEFLTPLVTFISHLGDAGLFWIVFALILTFIPKTRKYGALALSSLLFCFLINNVALKNLVARPRPYTRLPDLIMLMKCPADYSFPSGHSCASFAVASSLMWTMDKRWNKVKIPAIILASLIALSRIYVGVHYPTDVLVGTLIGIFGSLLICRLLDKPYDKLENRLKQP